MHGIQPLFHLELGVPQVGAFLVWMACPREPSARQSLLTHPSSGVPAVSPAPARCYAWCRGAGDLARQMDAAARKGGYHIPPRLPDSLRIGAPAPPRPRAAPAPAASQKAAPAQAAPSPLVSGGY